ncbi:hypothetical protein ABHM97_16685, partial [Paenarthrobacter sp. CAP02]
MPEILSGWMSTSIVDVVDGPVTGVLARVEVEDLGSGIQSVYLDPEGGGHEDPIPPKRAALVSGDAYHGIYEATLDFPEGIGSGDWLVRPIVSDQSGGVNAATDPVGLSFKVISIEDRDPPTLSGLDLSSSILDISDNSAELELRLKALDSGVGFVAGREIRLHTSFRGATYSTLLRNESKVSSEALYTTKRKFEKYDGLVDQRGHYNYWFDSLSDGNGNISAGRGPGATVIVATRPLRGKRPNLSLEGSGLRATWDVNQDLLGVTEYEAEFLGPETTRRIRTSETAVIASDLPSGDYTVRVRARNVLGWGQWTTDSDPEMMPAVVTPTAVTFTDKDGTKDDAYTVPATTGVEYLVGGKVVAAGSYPGSGTVTVTARAVTDYVLAPGATASWTGTFKSTPLVVTPAAVVFTDKDGTKDDAYTVPATTGVEYLVGGKVVAAGSYPGSGTVTVTARAVTDYVLAPGATASWTGTFKSTPLVVTP